MSFTATASIRALPKRTAQLLTSTQVITCPLSAIKELVENSLDARATTISVEISANTLDVIQVRDNGHGIAPDDRGICCKRHTTSKIKGIDELKMIGGVSLGFRGEALFSLREVAGEMTVMTRTEGECAAVTLNIGKDGEIDGRQTVSHPVGTTVRVTDFFRMLPVRKQNAEKKAAKSLASIRKLLQAYTLARPNVRMSMRVLKAKNDKSNFMYAPKNGGASVQDAAFKIVGKDCTSQCSWSILESNGYEVQALLPIPESVPAGISNTGHFLSIDSRPVSTVRGMLKKIMHRFNDKFKASNMSLSAVKDPFFAINIVCPKGSYDPNVEPAKDDVIFDDGEAVLNAVDELLSAVYPCRSEVAKGSAQDDVVETTPVEVEILHPTNTDHKELERLFSEDTDDFEETPTMESASAQLLQEARDAIEKPMEVVRHTKTEVRLLENRINIWRMSMYGCDEDDLDIFDVEQSQRPGSAHTETSRHDRQDLNPWTIAKLNAPVRPRVGAVVNEVPSSAHSPTPTPIIIPTRARSLSPTPNRASGIRRGLMSSSSSASIPYRRIPFLPYQPPVRRGPTPDSDQRRQLPPISFQPPFHQERPAPENQISLSASNPQSRFRRPHLNEHHGLPTPLPSSSPDFRSARRSVQKRPGRDNQKGPTSQIDNTFVPSVHNHDYLETGLESMPTKRPKNTNTTRSQGRDIRDFWGVGTSAFQNTSLVTRGEPEEVSIDEATINNEFATRLKMSQLQLPCPSPQEPQTHSRPMRDEIQQIERPAIASTAAASSWTPINTAWLENPKEKHTKGLAPLSKRRRTTEGKRTKSSRLPLERVPDGYQIHDLVHFTTISFQRMKNMLDRQISIGGEADFKDGALENFNALPDGIADSFLKQMGLEAIELLRQKLIKVEKENNQATALAFVGTLMRLDRAMNSDVVT